MTSNEHAVAQYRTDTLVDILSSYERKERKDHWDIERIRAIKAELKRRKESK